jgi:hypothetical protein
MAYWRTALGIVAFLGVAIAMVVIWPTASEIDGAKKTINTLLFPPSVVRPFPSPDGTYVAMLLNYNGGGAISSYCNDRIAIIPKSFSREFPHDIPDESYDVFRAECGTFADHSFSPKLDWISNSHLQITYSIHYTALSPAKVQLKKIDKSGQVSLRFIAHE